MDIRDIIKFLCISGGLGFLGFFAGFISLLVYRGNQAAKERIIAWQELANSNGLSFQAGKSLTVSSISGYYRGYYLQLSEGSITLTKPASDDPLPIIKTDAPTLSTESGLTLLSLADFSLSVKGEIEITTEGREIVFKGGDEWDDITYLQQIVDLLSDILDFYPRMVNRGGEVVPVLEKVARNDNHKLKNVAIQLLLNISQETRSRLSHQASKLLCPFCLEHCCARTIKLSSLKSITYYGCRSCGQSRDFIKDWAIAVLDRVSGPAVIRQDGEIRVNWLAHRKLFDFNQVEIVNATDRLSPSYKCAYKPGGALK